jgi:hypothetical protein
MDQAVALVETYLRINGFFTVTEFPVVEASRFGGVRSRTDLDILALRFPGAGAMLPSELEKNALSQVDPVLHCLPDAAEMIVGEVKEGKAVLNEAASDPAVLKPALVRFGCCGSGEADDVVQHLLRKGEARTHCNHRVRLFAFGSVTGPAQRRNFLTVSMAHISAYIEGYVKSHWTEMRQVAAKDPIFNLFVLLEKARSGSALSERGTD